MFGVNTGQLYGTLQHIQRRSDGSKPVLIQEPPSLRKKVRFRWACVLDSTVCRAGQAASSWAWRCNSIR